MLALVALVVMTFLSADTAMPVIAGAPGHGTCFPSLSTLTADDVSLSHWINLALIVGAALYSVFLTKHYNFVPADNLLFATSLLLMFAASPWVNCRLNDGVVMLWAVLICLHVLFSLYGRRNYSEGIFLIFSLLSWGSMVQYAFFLLMPVFLIGAVFLRAVRIREIVAMILGVAAPYWIVLATGLVKLSELQAPSFTFISLVAGSPIEVFRLMLTVGITTMLFLFALVVNLTHHGSAGVMVRARWSFLQLLGFASVVFILVDFGDMVAYLPVLFLCTGYGFAQWSIKMKASQKQYLVLALFVVYISLSVVFECL